MKVRNSEGLRLSNLYSINQLKRKNLKDVNVTRTIPIEIEWVMAAYYKVRRGGKGMGIDEESWTDFDKNVQKNIYLIWNRMSSGSYLPQAVREVEIPKKDGTMRKLGIPTLRDRIAQQVVKEYMEKRIDKIFHKNSYGYRPMKNAHQAIETVLENCRALDWVIDMDISKFFDEVDHELMLKAVAQVMPEKWISLYVKRWLEMPIQDKAGNIKEKAGKGTPQGGVISPLLANLYLHFTLDKWLVINYSDARFVRYADDVVIHCISMERAEEILQNIKERLQVVKLSIKESKTKIGYCKDYRRKEVHENVQFDFLGFSFKPTKFKSKFSGYFVGYGAEISQANQKRITGMIREEKAFKNTAIEIKEIAMIINAKLRGWINYYEFRGKSKLRKVIWRVEYRLIIWIKKKYKIFSRQAIRNLNEIKQKIPKLFYHWEKGYC